MIYLMKMEAFTGNSPYSIPSYSCVVVSAGGHAGTVGGHIVDLQYGGTHWPAEVEVQGELIVC
jgi:hypothetical protein